MQRNTAEVLVFLIWVVAAFITKTAESSASCPRVEKIGCFIDTLIPRPLPELLLTDRDPTDPVYSGNTINWYNFMDYLKGLVCRCAERTKERGFTHFGLQFYGECWSGPDAESRFAMHGPSKQCLMGLSIPPAYCNRTDTKACVGGPHLNYVYKIEEDRPKDPIDGKWSPWGPWTSCSTTCGPGTRSRIRECTNPPPENGGKTCAGNETQHGDCNVGKCPTPCHRDLDLGLVLDSSSSVGVERYQTAKEFLVNLVTNAQGSFKGTRIGIIVYNQEPQLQLTFNQTAALSLGEIMNVIRAIPYLHGGTRTDKALLKAATDLYTKKGGDRESVANVLLVVTDGRTNHLSEPYGDALKPLKERKVHVIVVGIGEGVKKSELLQIAMGNHNHVVTLADYQDLQAKLSDIVDEVCSAGNGVNRMI
ncbi:coadhesin-like [Actinia tenebrosa]|uniref:Coadhesin-like n=1 Tax=Actinia tenebrosa TaxID=6105 RepID=A0A6P8IJW5_ACTTE|nr:coadhesin-like [Actinia tenebrosa]